MSLFQEFPATSHDQWLKAVEKELKGLSFDDTLLKVSDIENLNYAKYADQRPVDNANLVYQRASRSVNNDWEINQWIAVKDEKAANQEALTALSQGASSLTFVLQKSHISWEFLLDKIEVNFIETQFKTIDEEQSQDLANNWSKYSTKPLIILNDFTEAKTYSPNRAAMVDYSINAYGAHQAGANAIEEIAFALSAGHAYLHKAMREGMSIDEASARIRFEMGIGGRYFTEVAKFRVFRKLWANVINAYSPKENCTHACYIYARTGFVNKSLKDPYTNLLRQTTEAMSAVIGGVNELNVMPYDTYAKSAERDLSKRMSINISHLLKEESYLQHVVDPMGGSYSIEQLSNELEMKAWAMFQELEKLGGIGQTVCDDFYRNLVKQTAKKRIDSVAIGESILIGVNKFPNPEEPKLEWSELPSYFNLPALVLENQI